MQAGATYSLYRAGSLIGTFTGRELERLARTGELEPGDEVEQPGAAGRRRIDEIPGLLGRRIPRPPSRGPAASPRVAQPPGAGPSAAVPPPPPPLPVGPPLPDGAWPQISPSPGLAPARPAPGSPGPGSRRRSGSGTQAVVLSLVIGGLLLLVAVIGVGVVLVNGRSQPGAGGFTVDRDHDFAILDEGVVLAGKRIRLPVSVPTLKAVLGPPDRSVALANTIYTWDDLGITAYEKPGSGMVSSIAFNFRPESFEFSPASGFDRLVLNGVTLTRSSKPADLAAAGCRELDGAWRADTRTVKAWCRYHPFAITGLREQGLILIEASKRD